MPPFRRSYGSFRRSYPFSNRVYSKGLKKMGYGPKKTTAYRRPRFRRGYQPRYRPQQRRVYATATLHRPLSSSGIPRTLTTKFRYVETRLVSMAALGATTTDVFRPFSLFDPDQTFIGHQAYLTDQVASLYSQYLVYGCAITVKMTPTTYNADLMQVWFRINPTGATITNEDLALEVGTQRTVSYQLTPGAGRPRIFRKYYALDKVLSIPKQEILSNVNYRTAYGGNPTAFVPTFTMSYKSATNGQPAYLATITIVQYVKLFELITQAQS